jgi:hypothetical protein
MASAPPSTAGSKGGKASHGKHGAKDGQQLSQRGKLVAQRERGAAAVPAPQPQPELAAVIRTRRKQLEANTAELEELIYSHTEELIKKLEQMQKKAVAKARKPSARAF